jgi:hypothetical protein
MMFANFRKEKTAAERRAKMVSALPIERPHAVRTLTAFRRRHGILPCRP